jgi:ABC-type nitrate/sulfonate/bicarbonate transport system substrate-binding protein
MRSTAINSLWYTRCPVPTASSIALHQGWLHQSFAEIGIALESVRASEDEVIRNSHYDNSLRNMFREGGNVPPIWARASGQPTVVVGITWVEEFQAIVVRTDSPLSSIADLQGKKLGLPRHPGELVDHSRASALHGFVSTLRIANISTDAVEFIDVAAPRFDIREDARTGVLAQANGKELQGSVLQSLRDGHIDAAYVKGPGGIRQMQKNGFKVLFDISAHPDPQVHVNNAVPRPITADRELVERHPDLVARYLSVLLRTGRWAEKNADEVLRLVALETSSSIEDAAAAYGPNLHQHFVPTLAPGIVAGLERQKNFLRDWNFLPADFDFASWIVPDPLAEAERIVANESLELKPRIELAA